MHPVVINVLLLTHHFHARGLHGLRTKFKQILLFEKYNAENQRDC